MKFQDDDEDFKLDSDRMLGVVIVGFAIAIAIWTLVYVVRTLWPIN